MADHTSSSYPDELSPSDSLMWHIERDPILRSPILVIGLLDREPGERATRASFERAVARFPRLRQRIVPAERPFGRLRWVDDPAFSLDHHVRRVRAPHPGDLRSVLTFAAPDTMSAFDPARPLWTCTIVEGLEGGRAAFVLKFHHTLTDGVGGIDLAHDVFDRSRRGSAVTLAADVERPAPAAGPNPFERAWRVATAGVGAARDPMGTASEVLRFGRSVARMLAPASEGLSPLFTTRGLDRHLDVLEIPIGDLRAAADAVGCTINDVFLAAIGGGLHDYHQRLGVDVPALRVTMPISIRSADDAPGGNQFTPARFILPVDDPDPAARAQIAGAIAHRWQAEPAIGLTDVLASLLDRLPTPVVTRIFGSMLKKIDVDAVDLQGLREPAYVGGARIDRLWAFAPPTGAALSVTLLTHLETACVTILSDTAAVAQPELVRTCLEAAFEQVASLGHGATRRAAS